MKRTVIEVSAGAVVLLVLGYFHAQLNDLNDTQANKSQEISKLNSSLATANLMLGEKEEIQDTQGKKITLLSQDLEALEGRMNKAWSNKVYGLEKSMQEIQEEKAQLIKELAKLKSMEKNWGTVTSNSKNLAGKLKTQEATLRRIQTNLMTDRTELIQTLLGPSVQLSGPETVGSGTIIYSRKAKKGMGFETYLFTSFHVVRNIFADIENGKEKVITVTVYKGSDRENYKADMVSCQKKLDMALLKVRSRRQFKDVAVPATHQELKEVGIFTRVIAVGCPLGNDPLPTQGTVSNLHNMVNGGNYWMINAPTYLGNSGGGVFLAKTRHLVGVFSKIYTHGTVRQNVVPHMGLCTPMESILNWLKKTDYSFITE